MSFPRLGKFSAISSNEFPVPFSLFSFWDTYNANGCKLDAVSEVFKSILIFSNSSNHILWQKLLSHSTANDSKVWKGWLHFPRLHIHCVEKLEFGQICQHPYSIVIALRQDPNTRRRRTTFQPHKLSLSSPQSKSQQLWFPELVILSLMPLWLLYPFLIVV